MSLPNTSTILMSVDELEMFYIKFFKIIELLVEKIGYMCIYVNLKCSNLVTFVM